MLVIAEVASQSGGYEKVDTSDVISAIQNGDAAKVTLDDRDQEVRVDLRTATRSRPVTSSRKARCLTDLVQEYPPPGGQVSEVPTQGWCSSRCSSRSDRSCLILLLLFFFMTQCKVAGRGS